MPAMWSVRIDADVGADYSEDLDEALRGRLAGHSPAVGAAFLGGVPVPGRITIQMTVEAATLRAAQERAHRAVASALAETAGEHQIVAMETLREEDFLAEQGVGPDVVDPNEIAAMLGVHRSRVHALAKDHPDFPSGKRLGRAVVYDRAAVLRWVASWRSRGRPGRPRKTPEPQNG